MIESRKTVSKAVSVSDCFVNSYDVIKQLPTTAPVCPQVVVSDNNTDEPLDYSKVNIDNVESKKWTNNETLAAPICRISTSHVNLAKDSNLLGNVHLENSDRTNRLLCPTCCKTFSSRGALRIHDR